ncbi:MAG TPA: hypothetical protein VGE39_12310 [Prosthecobacter sp.]
MKFFLVLVPLMSVLLLTATTLQAAGLPPPEGKEFAPPEENRPWFHEASGLRFPSEMKGLACVEGFAFAEEHLGSMLRYVERDLRIKADVYVYPCLLPHGTPEELKAAAVEEARQVLGGIQQAAKTGVYTDVSEPEVSYQELDLFFGDKRKTCLLTIPMQMTIHQDNGAGVADNRVHSFTAIFVYAKHYVKIRCSFSADKDDDKREKAVEEFVNAVRFCVQDPGLRTEMKQHIRTYQADPLSAKARDVVGALSVYADKSPLFGFMVPAEMVILGESLGKEVLEAQLDLMRAYMAGAVAEALQEPLPKDLNLEQAGTVQMVKVYELMKKQKPGLKNALFEEFAKAVAAGQGPEWFEAVRATREKEAKEKKE